MPDGRRGRCEFEAVVFSYPARKFLRQFDVAADMVLQTLNAVMANHKPQFERTKAAAQRDLPVAIIDDCAGFGGLVSQVFWQNAEGLY